jgi:hypothetical protein
VQIIKAAQKQIKHINSTNKKKTLKKQNKTKNVEKQYKRITGPEILYPDKT